MKSELILLKENSLLRDQLVSSSNALRESIREKNKYKFLVDRESKNISMDFKDLHGFFIEIQKFLLTKVDCKHGDYFLDSGSIQKLIEMFKPVVM